MSNIIGKAMRSFQGMSSDEKQSLAGLEGDDLVRAKAQLKLQKHAELTAFISNVMKMKHDTSMAIVNNVRS